MTALFGPIFVPLLMTKTFRAKFFHFLDVLISFAMIRAVAAAFIFVWAGFMNAFIQQTFNGNYSMEMWLANLIPCIMVFVAFIINMLFIPSMTQAIFGGAAGMAGQHREGRRHGRFDCGNGRRSIAHVEFRVRCSLLRTTTGVSQIRSVAACCCLLLGVVDRRIDLRRRRLPRCQRKESCSPCPRTQLPIEASLDAGASAAHRPDRQRGLCLALCRAESLPPHHRLWNGSALRVDVAQSSRWPTVPIANRYIRIDEMGRAQAIQYSDLNYSPREGEVRTYLTDWANYRYTISRDTIAKKYPLNYYFLSQTLASQLMTEDNQNHLVSQVVGGQIEQSDVEVKNVTITSMSRGDRSGRDDRAWNGACGPRQALLAQQLPRAEDGALDAQCHLLPESQTGQRSGQDLTRNIEIINPLGLTITEFHENRVSVDPIAPGTTRYRSPASRRSQRQGASR